MEIKYSPAAFSNAIVVCYNCCWFVPDSFLVCLVAVAVNLLQFTCALMSVIIHPTL